MIYRVVDDKYMCVPHSEDYINWKGEENVEMGGEIEGPAYRCEPCLEEDYEDEFSVH